MSRVLVTGANGFIGSQVCRVLLNNNFVVRAALRHRNLVKNPIVKNQIVVGDIEAKTQWEEALSNVDFVIHLAARVHIMQDTVSDPLAQFRKVNTDGTLNFAHQAAVAGVKRFVYLSSIKVNGEQTQPKCSFSAEDIPAPIDPYGKSKHEAEQGLIKLANETGMEVVIIRPPLVYGPGVKANFLSMMSWINKGIPLPFGAINNKRSFVALDNLIDLIMTCITHPSAANEVFLVSDGEDLSTTELLQSMAQAMNKSAKLIPVPSKLLKIIAIMLGKSNLAVRLLGSLQVDISKTRKLLDWNPPVSVKAALKATADDFLAKQYNI